MWTKNLNIIIFPGPVVGVVGQRFGIRAVTLGGAVVASLGAALCFVAPTVGWLAFCWGGVHGKYTHSKTNFSLYLHLWFLKKYYFSSFL